MTDKEKLQLLELLNDLEIYFSYDDITPCVYGDYYKDIDNEIDSKNHFVLRRNKRVPIDLNLFPASCEPVVFSSKVAHLLEGAGDI